jgi:hypothetical protein
MAMGNDQTLGFLDSLAANLLKKGRPAINQITGLPDNNKYPPAEPEVLRLLAPRRGLTAIG